MTRLTRPVVREVPTLIRGRRSFMRPLVVRLTDAGVMVRAKGTRTWFGPLTYGALYLHCAEVQAYEIRQAKAAKRKNARKAKQEGRARRRA